MVGVLRKVFFLLLFYFVIIVKLISGKIFIDMQFYLLCRKSSMWSPVYLWKEFEMLPSKIL